MEDESAAGVDGAAVEDENRACFRRKTDRLLGANQHDSHRSLLRMGADINHRTGKPVVGHPGHCDEQLPVEVTAPALAPSSWRIDRSHEIRLSPSKLAGIRPLKP